MCVCLCVCVEKQMSVVQSCRILVKLVTQGALKNQKKDIEREGEREIQ